VYGGWLAGATRRFFAFGAENTEDEQEADGGDEGEQQQHHGKATESPNSTKAELNQHRATLPSRLRHRSSSQPRTSSSGTSTPKDKGKEKEKETPSGEQTPISPVRPVDGHRHTMSGLVLRMGKRKRTRSLPPSRKMTDDSKGEVKKASGEEAPPPSPAAQRWGKIRGLLPRVIGPVSDFLTIFDATRLTCYSSRKKSDFHLLFIHPSILPTNYSLVDSPL
jgi:hypothetical protein